MQLVSSTLVTEGDVGAYAWSALRVFRNVEHTAAAIASAHGFEHKDRQNIKKQARQIRDCLIQAEEYARAAEAVSSATRPTLQYYSMMMLATAEVLFKGTGEVSLDRARGQHRHHGLTFVAPSAPQGTHTAADLRAKPVSFGAADRRGTFALWHRHSRLDPMCGETVINLANGGQLTKRSQILLLATDEPPSELDDDGVTLLDCLKHIPGLGASLSLMGARPLFARATLSAQRIEGKTDTTIANFHPSDAAVLQRIYGIVKSSDPDALTTFDYPSGRVYRHTRQNVEADGEPSLLTMPNGVTIGSHTYFWPYGDDEAKLNYFGWLYVTAFILGSYARYYPDLWMRDIEAASYLAGAADAFFRIAAEHGPLATYSALSRVYQVPPR